MISRDFWQEREIQKTAKLQLARGSEYDNENVDKHRPNGRMNKFVLCVGKW